MSDKIKSSIGSVPYLWRDDGERFSRNDDGTYTMDKNREWQPTCFYRYTFSRLMETGMFSVHPPQNERVI
jgi:hypothetical protein